MTKAEFLDLLARRAGKSRTQLQRNLDGLHSSGALKPTAARRTPPDVYGHDAALIVLAALVGHGSAVSAGDLTNAIGERLVDVLALLLDGPLRPVGAFIARADGASITIDGRHVGFGDPEAAGPAGFLPDNALMAIAAEYQGAKPNDADAMAALTQIRGI
jgi:hypothetical protein